MPASHVTDHDFDAQALHSDVPVLVDFWAPWCGPCKAMSPVVDELAAEFDGRAKVIKVNVDEAPQAAAQFGVASIPNFVVLKGGEKQSQQVGVRPKGALADSLNALLS